MKAAVAGYTWQFKARFRRHAFGWRSQPAAQLGKQAVSEIKAMARRERVLAADGAVAFLERVSPALDDLRQQWWPPAGSLIIRDRLPGKSNLRYGAVYSRTQGSPRAVHRLSPNSNTKHTK